MHEAGTMCKPNTCGRCDKVFAMFEGVYIVPHAVKIIGHTPFGPLAEVRTLAEFCLN